MRDRSGRAACSPRRASTGRATTCVATQWRSARSLLENQRLGRLEPAARSACSRGAKTLEKPPETRAVAALNQAVVVNSRIMVPLNVALTIRRAAPTAMKPTNARTHDPTKISERIPNTIAAIPIRISTPLAAAEPW